jgi:hypothetical protein
MMKAILALVIILSYCSTVTLETFSPRQHRCNHRKLHQQLVRTRRVRAERACVLNYPARGGAQQDDENETSDLDKNQEEETKSNDLAALGGGAPLAYNRDDDSLVWTHELDAQAAYYQAQLGQPADTTLTADGSIARTAADFVIRMLVAKLAVP